MHSRLTTWLLIGPGLGWLALFMVVPCCLVFAYAFFERGVYGGIEYTFTFANFGRALESVYLTILVDSARIAFLATLFLRHRPCASRPADGAARTGDAALLVQLPDPHLRLDGAAEP
jgi:hypothetical protein